MVSVHFFFILFFIFLILDELKPPHLETTAASLAFTFYLLSQHKEVERKVLKEIDTVIGDDALTYEKIQQLKYLPLVMKESMR